VRVSLLKIRYKRFCASVRTVAWLSVLAGALETSIEPLPDLTSGCTKSFDASASDLMHDAQLVDLFRFIDTMHHTYFLELNESARALIMSRRPDSRAQLIV
jgi:hypothetical protein